MFSRRLFGLVLIALTACVCGQAVFGDNTYPPDISAIKNRGALIVAMTGTDQPPFYFVNAKGELKGLDVEIAQSVADALGVKLQINRDAKAFNDVVEIVASGKADLAISKLSINSKRSERVLFSDPYIIFRQALILNRLLLARKANTDAEIDSFVKKENFTGKIGVLEGSYVNFATTNFPQAKVEAYGTWDQAVEAVFAGDVLAAYRDEMEIKKIVRGKKDAALKTKTVLLRDTEDRIAIAVAWQNTHLHYWLNFHLRSLQFLKGLSAESLLDRYPEIFTAR